MGITTIPNIRCLECGEDAVELRKDSKSICDVLSAECESCGVDIKKIIDELEENPE